MQLAVQNRLSRCLSSLRHAADSSAGRLMRRPSGGCGQGFLVAVLLTLCSLSAWAQVVPAIHSRARMAIYGDFSAAQPNFGTSAGFIYGFTVGGYLQSSHVIGFDMRGIVLRAGGPDHESSVLVGPRAAFHFARFSPYTALDVGAGHAWRYPKQDGGDEAQGKRVHGTGLQWSLIGGMDLYWGHHVSVRMAELTYSSIYATNQSRIPINYSTGLIYRFK